MILFSRQEMNELVSAEPLSTARTKQVFAMLVQGEVHPTQAAAIVAALRVRGERSAELVGAAEALLESATAFPPAPCDSLDIVGTGGDGQNTLNLSTLAAITAAACGVPVTKHGNRSITSLTGSFDLLAQLGLVVELDPVSSARCLKRCGLCFLYAPLYHPGLRHLAELRKGLNLRTIFNLLGPLVNPARPRYMLLGVAQPELLRPVAEALRGLGCHRAAVVHGSGTDEVATHGPTQTVWLESNQLHHDLLMPENFGFSGGDLSALVCRSADECLERSRRILRGDGTPEENSAIAANVAVALRVYRNSENLKPLVSEAQDCLKSGRAGRLLERYRQESNL